MALANGIRDATVTYMLSTNATPFVKLLVWLLRSFTPTHIFYIHFSSSFYNPWFTLFIAVTKIRPVRLKSDERRNIISHSALLL